MLREIVEFLDMSGNAEIFWKKYVKIESAKRNKKNNEDSIKINDGRSVEQSYFESLPQEADALFKQSSNETKLENSASDFEMNSMDITNDAFVEIESITTVVDLKINRFCDICDKGK